MATTRPMDKMKDLLGYFLAAMAMFALLCAVYEAMNQRVASAGVLGTLFLVTALLFYLPQLEVIKAFGVEAKMRETLTEAQEIIARMKNLAEVNAEAAYELIAWGNRFGGMPFEEKQKLIDNIDLQLKSLGTTGTDLEKLKSCPARRLLRNAIQFSRLSAKSISISVFFPSTRLTTNRGTTNHYFALAWRSQPTARQSQA